MARLGAQQGDVKAPQLLVQMGSQLGKTLAGARLDIGTDDHLVDNGGRLMGAHMLHQLPGIARSGDRAIFDAAGLHDLQHLLEVVQLLLNEAHHGKQQRIALQLGKDRAIRLAHGALAQDLGLLRNGVQLAIKLQFGQQMTLALGQAVAAHQTVCGECSLGFTVGVIDKQSWQTGWIPRHLHPLVRGFALQELAHGG